MEVEAVALAGDGGVGEGIGDEVHNFEPSPTFVVFAVGFELGFKHGL